MRTLGIAAFLTGAVYAALYFGIERVDAIDSSSEALWSLSIHTCTNGRVTWRCEP